MNGENIAVIRKRRGITQEELAQMLSVNTITLSRWENGHFEPKASMINKLCKVLHCTETELLNGTENSCSKVTLSYDWEKFDKGDVDMTGKGYELFLGADGVIGLKGSMFLKSREEIEDCLIAIKEQLTIAYDAQERRGAIKEA